MREFDKDTLLRSSQMLASVYPMAISTTTISTMHMHGIHEFNHSHKKKVVW